MAMNDGERDLRRIDDELISDADVREYSLAVSRHMHTWLEQKRLRFVLGISIPLVALALLALGSVAVVGALNRLSGLQRTDSSAAKRAAYATCVRGLVGRLDLHVASKERGEEKLLNERRRRIPILDCSPSLRVRGALARPLPVAQQRRAETFFEATNRVPIIAAGRLKLCPDPDDTNEPVTRWERVPKNCLVIPPPTQPFLPAGVLTPLPFDP